MKRCKSCQVEVLDNTMTCPLCNRVLSDDGKEFRPERMYPDPEEDRERLYGIKNIFFILLGMIAVLMGIINYITYNGFLWSVIVMASILYLMMTVSYSIVNRRNLAAKIVVEVIGGGILVFVIDYVIGYEGWSVAYVIPGLILTADLAMVVLVLVNRKTWYSYLMYLIFIAALSLIPVILYLFGLFEQPLVALISCGISVLTVFIILAAGNKKGKNELARRFHT
ncbi:DUF6320 domain-containing protein [Anaerostipes sp.]|uniref:DUF6320 domain-containing protein n=1 Tax=Anaerostipes sp. TaxID=1872530 RepID=UPI0025BE4E6F|nr:DUF6320 domain-containing protein [Anaerostipes sp.]MBS7007232.1 hypothetical protein [Anaerostipes sp.]